MRPYFLDFEYEAAEDFHSGSGMGHVGLYDVGQQSEIVDGRPVPVVRSDTFKGLLRDSCEWLTESPLYQEEWQQRFPDIPLETVFSECFKPQSGDSLFFSSLRPTKESLVQFDDPFRIISQTAIDLAGGAKYRSLRSIQCGRAGLVLHGEVRGRTDEDRFKPVTYFLWDGLLRLRRLGGRRRRGIGKIRLLTKDLHPRVSLDSEIPKWDASRETPYWLLLTLEATEGIHVTDGTPIANIVPCRDSIPGSVILGALRHEWRIQANDTESENPESAAKLLQDDTLVSFGPFFPLPEGMERVTSLEQLPVPLPLSWQYPRGCSGKTIADRKVRFLLWDDVSDKAERLKRMEAEYRIGDQIYQPRIEVVIRTKIARETGRVEEGNLFSMEYLPAGTRFAGSIYFPGPSELELFLKAFGYIFSEGFRLGIGRGRKPVKVAHTLFEPCSSPPVDEPAPKSFSLHLTSDAYGRDDYLQYSTEIESFLEMSMGEFPYQADHRFEKVAIRRRFSPVGGLPDFPFVALAARSSFRFRQKDEIEQKTATEAWQKLRTLELSSGIGEGKAFGLGRFSLEVSRPSPKDLAIQIPHLPTMPLIASGHRETVFASAKSFYEDIHSKSLPRSSQWHLVLGSLRARVHESHVAVLKELIIERDTVGGREWASVGPKLLEAVEKMSQKDTVLFLETLIRYIELEGEK